MRAAAIVRGLIIRMFEAQFRTNLDGAPNPLGKSQEQMTVAAETSHRDSSSQDGERSSDEVSGPSRHLASR
jgi:hypothetical protein